jgi:hypothetical protein
LKLKTIYLVFVIVLLSNACVEKMQLPDSLDNDGEFSAGDTTFLLIHPIWDEKMGLQHPVEISVASNGYVFVADSGTKSIIAFNQSGEVLEGFEDLQNLNITPIDLDIDQKMNVFFTDGSQKIYIWNYYINTTGIDEMAVSGSFFNEAAGSVTIDAFNEEWSQYLNDADWVLEYVNWGAPQAVIDSLLAPHVFYDGALSIHSFNDIYYNSEESNFSGLSATQDKSNYIFALDHPHDRIIRIDLQRTHLIRLSNGEEIWTHRGVFAHTVTDQGTGAGTVDDPTGIDVDYNGNIYYSQTGEYFTVHKIRKVSGSNNYPSVFDNGMNEIMDLYRFSSPADVAVDNNQFVYVANTEAQEVQVFDSNGKFFLKAGVETFIVDTTMQVIHGLDTVVVDTFITIEEKGFLVEPSAITVDDRGIVYICDTITGRILRYRLSNQLDEDLQPIP